MYRVSQKKRHIRRSVIMEKNGLHHRFSRELALHFEYSLTPKKLILRPQGSKIKFKYYTFWVEMNHWAFLTLTLLILFDLDETFKDISDECSLPSDTISRSISYVHVLLDSIMRLGGQVESWHDSWSWWNFHRYFWSMFPPFWHHLQVYKQSSQSRIWPIIW